MNLYFQYKLMQVKYATTCLSSTTYKSSNSHQNDNKKSMTRKLQKLPQAIQTASKLLPLKNKPFDVCKVNKQRFKFKRFYAVKLAHRDTAIFISAICRSAALKSQQLYQKTSLFCVITD